MTNPDRYGPDGYEDNRSKRSSETVSDPKDRDPTFMKDRVKECESRDEILKQLKIGEYYQRYISTGEKDSSAGGYLVAVVRINSGVFKNKHAAILTDEKDNKARIVYLPSCGVEPNPDGEWNKYAYLKRVDKRKEIKKDVEYYIEKLFRVERREIEVLKKC